MEGGRGRGQAHKTSLTRSLLPGLSACSVQCCSLGPNFHSRAQKAMFLTLCLSGDKRHYNTCRTPTAAPRFIDCAQKKRPCWHSPRSPSLTFTAQSEMSFSFAYTLQTVLKSCSLLLMGSTFLFITLMSLFTFSFLTMRILRPFQRHCRVAYSPPPATSRSVTAVSRRPPASPPPTLMPSRTTVTMTTFANRTEAVGTTTVGIECLGD